MVAPRMKTTSPVGTGPPTADVSAEKEHSKIPFDSSALKGLFLKMYTLSSTFSTTSAGHMYRFGVASENDKIMVHPSVTSFVRFSLISPLNPPAHFSTTSVSVCSPLLPRKHWMKMIDRNRKIQDMLTVYLSTKENEIA